MKITFWGTRGSLPAPYPDLMKYGGNTSCVEIRTRDNKQIILDCGTGLRRLGIKLIMAANTTQQQIGKFELSLDTVLGTSDAVDVPESLKSLRGETPPDSPIHILLSHNHWDHIMGMPFFIPFYIPGNEFVLYNAEKNESLEDIMVRQMSATCFPIEWTQLASNRQLKDISAEEKIIIGDTVVRALPLAHPNGCMGYRITCGEITICYATDNEHPQEGLSPNLMRLARDADLLIYDGQYTPDEYASKVGWGHSTWEKAVELAKEVNVNQIAIFHHDPEHNDAFLDKMEAEAKKDFPNIFCAREGEENEMIFPPFEETDFDADF